ncbi:MAG TPA: VCBS repeat-containing protein, partial [Vicinamibacterales bacterium]
MSARTSATWFASGLIVFGLAVGCRKASDSASTAPPSGPPWFEEIASRAGIDFVHASGHEAKHYLPEIMGGGAALFDMDNDGLLDLYLVQSGRLGDASTKRGRLYRNRGDGTFEDATEASGVRRGYWGWGATFEDFDDDGHLDLFHVNGFGVAGLPSTAEFFADPARLFVGTGAGTFVEMAQTVGVADTGEGRGVVAFDYDRDGDLDLFVWNNGGPG